MSQNIIKQRMCSADQRERGQAELSYLLILIFVAVPLYVAVQLLFRVLLRYYETTSFFLALPFP